MQSTNALLPSQQRTCWRTRARLFLAMTSLSAVLVLVSTGQLRIIQSRSVVVTQTDLATTPTCNNITGNWTVTSLASVDDEYPQYHELSDFLEGPGLTEPRLDVAVCEFRYVRFWQHFPHTMQQLYRCSSWWLAHPDKKPVLTFELMQSEKMTRENTFLKGYLKVFNNTVGLEVTATHEGPAVRCKDTGKWIKDIALTDFAMFDPDRLLRKLFVGQIPSVIDDPPCPNASDRRPRIAILNRELSSGRRLLNAELLASTIERALPDQKVPIVAFEHLTFLEQARFFMETDILISPHGAQLTGIAFMPNCASLLEFFPRDYLVADYFASLALAVGVNHSFFYMADNEDDIPDEKRYHYMISGDFRRDLQCPDVAKVVAAVTEMVRNWRPCCSVPDSANHRLARLLATNTPLGLTENV